jgi:hypothetical protein
VAFSLGGSLWRNLVAPCLFGFTRFAHGLRLLCGLLLGAFVRGQIFDSGPKRLGRIECLFEGVCGLGFNLRFNVLGRSRALRLHAMFCFLVEAGL